MAKKPQKKAWAKGAVNRVIALALAVILLGSVLLAALLSTFSF